MLQVIQHQRTGVISVAELPEPSLRAGGIIVNNVYSLISAGTERTSVETAQASMLGKARSRPDLVLQVMDTVRKEGLVSTIKKVQNRLDNFKELGYSTAGIVVESSVPEFKPGDRVACAGAGYASHAESVFIPKNLAVHIPDDVSFEDAAYTTLGSIALQGVRQADVRVGEVVVVSGLGLLGLLTVQLLKASGCTVIGLDVHSGNFALARKLGSDECIKISGGTLKQVGQLTKGYGADAVVLTAATSSNDPIRLATQMARKKGRVVIVGAVGLEIPRSPFYEKELDIRISCSYGPGRYDPAYEEAGQDYPFGYVRWTENRNMEAFLSLVAQKKVNVGSLTTHRIPITDAIGAYDLITGKKKERYLGILLHYQENERLRPRQTVVTRPPESTERSAQPVRVGIIGAGNFAQAMLLPNLVKLGVPLAGVADSKPVNAKGVADKFGFGFYATDPLEVLDREDINTMIVGTRHDMHASLVVEALKRKKKVFVEKPLAVTRAQLAQVQAEYARLQKAGTQPTVMVGFNRRFSEPMRIIKEFFSSRLEPLVMTYRVNAGYIPPEHWVQQAEQGGRIIGEGCHFFDVMQFLTDARPTSVTALPASDNARRYSMDNMSILVEFSDGSSGVIIYAANGAPGMSKEYLEVFGDGRSAQMDDFRRLVLYDGRGRTEKKFSPDKGHFNELKAFLETAEAGTEGPIPFASLVASTEASIAAVESSISHHIVRL